MKYHVSRDRMKEMKKSILIISYLLVSITLFPQNYKQNLPDSVYNNLIKVARGKIIIGDTTYHVNTTISFYVVATIKNEKNNKVKEICTPYSNLIAALNKDTNAIVNWNQRRFNFFSKKALNFIGFDNYNCKKEKKIASSLYADSLYKEAIKSPINFSNKYSGENQRYIAHFLFNHGILCFRGDLVGNLNVVPKEYIEKYIRNPSLILK